METTETGTLVVGASIAGLATAACLQKKGLDHLVIEKESSIASPWRRHYDRLHLHTNKGRSGLPYKSYGKEIPRYPNRLQVIDYLGQYAVEFGIDPIFNTEAVSIRKENKTWITETNRRIFRSRNLVVATGAFGEKKTIKIAGMDSFPGLIQHSSEYRTGKAFEGKHVLVVGFGNSACEIALDLFEQGAHASISVRSPVNVMPRDILGIPLVEWGQILSRFPAAVADAIGAPLIKWEIGKLEKTGLEKKAYGPFTEIANDRQTGVIDVGTIARIRDGSIKLFNSINRIEVDTVLFDDGRSAKFDAIILGTGFLKNIPKIEGLDQTRIRDLNLPIQKREYFGKDGLYFCGFHIGATGHIQEIGKDALAIANRISLFLNA